MPWENAPDRAAIVAARNEATSIGETLEALGRALPGIALYAADDGSEDATAAVAAEHGATVVGRRRALGKGGNVSAAAETALHDLAEQGTFLLCDADLGASAEHLAALVEAVEADECDLAVAAFAKREGGGFGVALRYAHDKIEELSGFDARAPISGQRAMRADVLRGLLPLAEGFGMEIGMTVDAVRAGQRVKEIELPLEHRATHRTPAGFLHRGRQLRDFRRAVRARHEAREVASPP